MPETGFQTMSAGSRSSFDQIVSKLPSVDAPPQPVGSHAAFEASPRVIDHFVHPTFETLEWPESAGVLLIEAPGAVGKTVTGEALAATLGWPLVRAEKAQVGSYSLSGLINDALDFSDYLARIRDALAGIVVDSLDEAHLKAGTQNFLAFIQNIISIRGRRAGYSKPSIILMSRTDTAELIQAAFMEASTPLAHARLSFFDYGSAVEFIRSHLKSRFEATGQPEYNVALASPRPFGQLVDERFRQLMQILLGQSPKHLQQDWDSCDEFLGYAPVLTVIAESVACTNPAKELAELKKANLASNDQLLLDICDRILRREQEKFSKNYYLKLTAALPADDPRIIAPDSVYSPPEQLLRVFAMATDAVVVAAPPADLPGGLRQMYEESVRQFAADHPFIRNGGFSSTVFKDFTSASLADSLSARASLAQHPANSIKDVGPFFCGFFRCLASDSATPRAPEQLILPLAASWRQWCELTRSGDGTIAIHLHDGHGILATSTSDDENGEQGFFDIYDLSGALALPHVPRNFILVSDQGVILGERNRALNIGPGSVVSASEIDIQSDALSFQGTHGARRAAFAADVVRADYLATYSATRDELQIYAEQMPQLLYPLQARLTAARGIIPFSDYVDLRAILLSLRRTVHTGISAQRVTVERIVRGNDHREQLLRSLIDSGVVELKDDWYRLRSDNLASVGFSLQNLKNGEPTQAVLDYLGKVRHA